MAVAHRGLFCKVVLLFCCSGKFFCDCGQRSWSARPRPSLSPEQAGMAAMARLLPCQSQLPITRVGVAHGCLRSPLHRGCCSRRRYIYIYIYIYIHLFIFMYTIEYLLVQTQGISCCGDKSNNQIVQRNILISKRD